MTVSMFWRPARWPVLTALLAALLSASLLLAGCGSAPKEESANDTADRLYKEAKEDMNAGSFERAIKSLERVEGLAAGSLLAQQALLDISYMQWRTGEKAQALTSVERFIKLNPSSPALDYALYLRGIINFNDNMGLLGSIAGQDLSERDQRASRDAHQAFRQLIDQFPASPYSADARLRMAYIVDTLAMYEVHVARYYLRRGAYVAAANRAQGAVSDFAQTASVEEALAILVKSYGKLELTTLRDDAERVLRTNYPNSKFLARGELAGETPWWRLW